MSNFIISCGGTGGHFSPGIAIGQALMRQGHKVVFIISQKKIDSILAEKYPEYKFYKAPGIAFSKSPIALAKFAFTQMRSLMFSIKLLTQENCDVAISFGGFNSLGLALAAKIRSIPVVLHEANHKVGNATRKLSYIANRVYIPSGVELRRRKNNLVKYAGYPVREEIQAIQKSQAKEFFGFKNHENVLLVFGGSQGSLPINNWVAENAQYLLNKKISILCIGGENSNNLQNMKVVDENSLEHNLINIPFCNNMAEALSLCEVTIARAGAGSIAEIARCKVPSILIPYPYAADNHQLENAKYVERFGAAILVEQRNLDTLTKEIEDLFFNDSLKESIVKNLSIIDNLNDISKIVEDLTNIAQENFYG